MKAVMKAKASVKHSLQQLACTASDMFRTSTSICVVANTRMRRSVATVRPVFPVGLRALDTVWLQLLGACSFAVIPMSFAIGVLPHDFP